LLKGERYLKVNLPNTFFDSVEQLEKILPILINSELEKPNVYMEKYNRKKRQIDQEPERAPDPIEPEREIFNVMHQVSPSSLLFNVPSFQKNLPEEQSNTGWPSNEPQGGGYIDDLLNGIKFIYMPEFNKFKCEINS